MVSNYFISIKPNEKKTTVYFYVDKFRDWLKRIGIKQHHIEKAINEIEEFLSKKEFKQGFTIYVNERNEKIETFSFGVWHKDFESLGKAYNIVLEVRDKVFSFLGKYKD